jgi:hypothetical protein
VGTALRHHVARALERLRAEEQIEHAHVILARVVALVVSPW